MGSGLSSGGIFNLSFEWVGRWLRNGVGRERIGFDSVGCLFFWEGLWKLDIKNVVGRSIKRDIESYNC